MYKPIIYRCERFFSQEDADYFALQLWHFSNLFADFSFTINGKEFFGLSERPSAHDVYPNEKQLNFFTLEFSDSNEDYFETNIMILNYSLRTFLHVPFVFRRIS